METFLQDELGDSRLVKIPGLVEHLFPTERLALSVDAALRALLDAKKLVDRDGALVRNTDLKFLGDHDSCGAPETMLKDFLTEISSALRDACPNCPETLRRWSTAATSRSLKEEPADRKPEFKVILSSAKDEDITNENVLSLAFQLKSDPDHSTQALEQVLNSCFTAFSTQTHRRFMVFVTFYANSFRVYHIDRSGLLSSIAFDIAKDIQIFVRLLIGLTLCPATATGKDLTVFEKDGHQCIEVTGLTYRLLECVFQSEAICDRGTICWRAVREGDETGTQYAIKDTWTDTSREPEKEIMEKLKGIKGLATLVAAEKVDNGDGMDTTDYIRSTLSTDSWRQNIEVRQLWRIVTTPFGDELSMFSSKRELLSTLIDTIRTHQEMLETKNTLHRDISYGNVMMHPAVGNLNSESINAAAPPQFREGLLIDVDHSIDVKALPRKMAAAGHRTGTLPFMAVNVLLGREHQPHHDLESFFYVLVWICTFYEGPNNSPRKDITAAAVEWTGIGILDSYKGFASRKTFAFRSDDQNFQDEVLHFVTPYFDDLRPCLSDLQDCFYNKVPPTHTTMIGILRHHMSTLPDEVDKPSTDTKKDARDSTREVEEPVPYLKKVVVPRPQSSHAMVTRSRVARSGSDGGVASSSSNRRGHTGPTGS